MPTHLSVPLEAALAIPVPEAEVLVGPFRQRYDPSAQLGVSAHITINYPFLPGVEAGEEVFARLNSVFSTSSPFSFSLNRVERFPDVLYLAPEPQAPFLALIASVAGRFPDSPPYGGAFERVVPHLTVAQSDDEGLLRSVEREFRERAARYLPLTVHAERVWLLDNPDSRWRKRYEFRLGEV